MLYLVIDPCFVKGDIPPVSQIYLPEDGTWYLEGIGTNYMPCISDTAELVMIPWDEEAMDAVGDNICYGNVISAGDNSPAFDRWKGKSVFLKGGENAAS